MNAFTNYLEKLGSNFIVSAMIPSLALVIVSILVFDPILHVALAFNDPQASYQLVTFSLIVFTSTVIIGFTLTALNTFILKVFEGYVSPFPIRFLHNITRHMHVRNAAKIAKQRDELKKEIRRLQKQMQLNVSEPANFEDLQDQYYKVVADYSLNYPDNISDILPTRFGNTLKAAENYAGERYGFDGVLMWPRLMHVVPSEYKSSIDAVRNELSFLVNMSLLSAVFSLFCIIAVFQTMWATNMVTGGAAEFATFLTKGGSYLIAAAIGFISCGFFYNASLFSVGSFGLVIRSTVDLFRLDLMKKLGLTRPKDTFDEFKKWQHLNELIVLGRHSLFLTKLDFRKKE